MRGFCTKKCKPRRKCGVQETMGSIRVIKYVNGHNQFWQEISLFFERYQSKIINNNQKGGGEVLWTFKTLKSLLCQGKGGTTK